MLKHTRLIANDQPCVLRNPTSERTGCDTTATRSCAADHTGWSLQEVPAWLTRSLGRSSSSLSPRSSLPPGSASLIQSDQRRTLSDNPRPADLVKGER